MFMRNWRLSWIVWNAEAGGGASSSTGDAGGGEAAAGDGGGGDKAPADTGSILDTASKSDGKAPDQGTPPAAGGDGAKDAAPFDPGNLPDGVLGKTNEETIRNLQARFNDARRAISKGQHKAAEDVPESADKYTFEPVAPEGGKPEDDVVALALNSEESKEVMGLVRGAAHKAGIGNAQLNGFLREFMEQGGDAGMFLSDEDAVRINGQNERAELVKMVGSPEKAQNMIDTVEGYGQQLLARGVFSKEELAEFRVAAGTATAISAMHKVIGEIAGFKPVPRTGVRGEGQYSVEDAYAKQAEMLRMPDGPEKRAARQEVDRIFGQVFGDAPASDSRQVRESATR